MRPQYYEPPRQTWLDSLRPWFEPPRAYLVFFIGVMIAIYLSIQRNEASTYGPRLLILLIAFPIHELSHALTADRLGDSTPRRSGRITLNPFAQLNLIGSILMLAFGLGWAYVPINPNALRPNPRTGHMLVAAAGPLANLLLAVLVALLWHAVAGPLRLLEASTLLVNTGNILYSFAWINVALFLFNLIPLPPLDGFAILGGLLPSPLANQLERIRPFSFLIFMAVFLIGGRFIGYLIFTPADSIVRLLFGL